MPSDGGGSSDNSVNRTDTVTLPQASDRETQLREMFSHLNDKQINLLGSQLQQMSQAAYSPMQLNTGDHVELNKAFNSARDQFNFQSKDYADFLAGSRGMRMSDTPISQQALMRHGLGLGQIESDRARAGLDLGLQSNMFRTNAALGLGTAIPGAGGFNLGQYLQERQAQPTTRSVGTGFSNNSYTPPNNNLNTGIAIAGAVGTAAMAI